jgi:hypothetical protein
MLIACPAPGCAEYRRHHEDPDTPRGPQMVEMPDDLSHPVFCSLTCAAYAGYYNIRENKICDRSNWKFEWPPKNLVTG